MKDNLFIKNFQKISFVISFMLVSISILLFIIFYYGYKIDDSRNLLALIPALLSLFVIGLMPIIASKKIMKFIRNYSKLIHKTPTVITSEYLTSVLKQNGFDMFCFNNTTFGFQLINEKSNFKNISCCYAFLILDSTMNEKEMDFDIKEIDKLFNNYFNNKKMYNQILIHPVFCFFGDTLDDKLIEKCKKGLVLKSLLANIQEFYIGYETKTKTLYYTDATEKLPNNRLVNFSLETKCIREIFGLSNLY